MNTEQFKEYDDEVTLKELILKIQEFLKILWAKKIWILCITLIVGSIVGLHSYLKEDVYPATITFMVKEDNGSSGMGGATALLGQFGLGGSNSEYNLDKILALAKTNAILGEALLDTNNSPMLANQLIETYNLHEKWDKSDLLKGYYFKNSDNELAYNKALKSLIGLVRGNDTRGGIATFNYTEETGIITIKVSSRHPQISIDLTNAIYNRLSNFYITEAIERPLKNYKLLAERADSVARKLAAAEQQIANFIDGSQGLLLQSNKVNLNRAQRNAQLLAILYAEVVKNKETAHFILKLETPYFQVIDTSKQPINKTPKGEKKAFIIGALLGGILSSIFILGIRIYKETMEN